MYKIIVGCCVVAVAGWIGFSTQPSMVSGERMLQRIRTDAQRNWPGEKFRGCPNITYHVPDGHRVSDNAEWDQSLREAVKQYQQASIK